ncbi:hypothetical protein HAX54_039119, partial [Datura stramonium]|nr:hypothetical protein [Datura stramonium]
KIEIYEHERLTGGHTGEPPIQKCVPLVNCRELGSILSAKGKVAEHRLNSVNSWCNADR